MLTKINVKWEEAAVSHFMTELIDYAGLFPPAALPLAEAISNYHSYIHGSDSWMLGPFVIPASRLNELQPFAAQFNDQYPLRLSVILSKSETIEKEIEAMNLFLETYDTAGSIEAVEVPLPEKVDFSFLEKLEQYTGNYPVYCEMTGTNQEILTTLDAISSLNQISSKSIGVKMRMGGIRADLFPSAERAAFIIHETQKRGLAIKFTAGLHHPIRQYRNEVETKMHGFVNVFTASIMAYCRSIHIETIQAILLDEDPTNFSFTKEALSWRNFTVSSAEIDKARTLFAASYGSCSFDEPREELGELTIFQGEAAQ
ncbi:hypothetical protein RRU94_00895 [Domibacillus sp. DTU_2020_1001157_1_SI_ALB_TIR_016]|uniref:hypothetical protein n=1 Tax=Domibacillus sp. DTU_2020_1001157_1_SI_ALB_TIR_016 TaxID=3077789 RepID=UPI0028E6E9FE|nr:hypothetical protein [Domibacillus sp. DTU_2020_1001157_1_SI_ALB_TIR_016]WNS78566.1 hypothetical protein RRU94_00895 [Domibacillus sp. DTU_2020_1001157_1_SI_ALB_TIR_016]